MKRFWDKVNKNGPLILKTRCWVWTGFINKDGYGKFTDKVLSQYATRAAWELKRGPIPKGLITCHKCDNRSCVRPSHIFIGTDRDNVLDCVAKNRCYRGGMPPKFSGENHPNRVLTEKIILKIRKEYTGKYGELTAIGKRYGVSRSTIGHIVHGRAWIHVK